MHPDVNLVHLIGSCSEDYPPFFGQSLPDESSRVIACLNDGTLGHQGDIDEHPTDVTVSYIDTVVSRKLGGQYGINRPVGERHLQMGDQAGTYWGGCGNVYQNGQAMTTK